MAVTIEILLRMRFVRWSMPGILGARHEIPFIEFRKFLAADSNGAAL
jgi:hypothetical protein